jgi:predicted dehydrogenase
METLRVGVIGANADRGWARESHVPAVHHLDGLELAAIANRSEPSAVAAAEAFGAPRAYGDPAELIADPDVDVVAITTTVPTHRDLVLAALRAGRHVYVEWPLAASRSDAESLASAAQAAGVHLALGLQGRMNPAAVRARTLVRGGAVGRILSASMYSCGVGFGPSIPEGYVHLEDPATGMNITTITVGHAFDFAIHLCGALTSVSALTTVQHPSVEVVGAENPLSRTIPEHVLAHGRLADGGAFSARVFGGRAEHAGFRLEIIGTAATLVLTGDGRRGFQAGTLTLEVDGEPVEVATQEAGALPPAAVNVAGLYAALRDDITRHTRNAPSADDGVRLHQLIDDLLAAGRDGTRHVPVAPWPGPGNLFKS